MSTSLPITHLPECREPCDLALTTPENPSVEGTVTGRRWILDGGLRGGGPGKPPCWRMLEESCKGLGSVSLKVNNQHTHTGACQCAKRLINAQN